MTAAGWFYFDHLLEYGEIYPDQAVRDVLPPMGPGLPLDHPSYRGEFQARLARSYWYVGGTITQVADEVYQLLHVVAGIALGGLVAFTVAAIYLRSRSEGSRCWRCYLR